MSMYGDPEPNYGGAYGGGGDLVTGLIQLGGGLYDSYRNRKASKENTNKTIAANKREAELAYQREVEMWNMQNMYNSPEAQMNRFKAAGLNPHLIYGQGNAGNASSFPEYQPAEMQYRYAAPAYGAAAQSVLPTLMSVGTWMQNMRSSEIDNQLKLTNTQRAEQVLDYMSQMNPKLLEQQENKLSLFPYQQGMMQAGEGKAWQVLDDLQTEYRHKYGDELWGYLPKYSGSGGFTSDETKIGGTKRLDFLLKQAQLEQSMSKSKLMEAQASWTDFGITNPQAIMQMVLGGVMGLAGKQLRLSTHRKNPGQKITHTQSMRRVGRTSSTKTEYYKR